MLRGAFRTKEGKIIAAIIGLVIIIIGIFAFTGYSQNKKFVEQAVMAENYLKAGSYEQAIEAYLKALSMKNHDEELLTIGLSEAYAGLKEFDKALEALRACYQKTSGTRIKKKIEELTSEKTDYEYLQSISHAEVYFTNNEFSKAIAEFEKAKQIKSKDATAYQRIAEAYIKMGEYDLAREEVMEGQEITQDESLERTLDEIDSYLKKEQYDALIVQGSEYILQENFKEGIAQYEEAISLIPGVSTAYCELAKTYIQQEEYYKAVLLLQDASGVAGSRELYDLLKQATELKELADQKNNILLNLYGALEKRNYSAIIKIIDMDFFKENIVKETPVFYNGGEGDVSDGLGMVIYDKSTVYYGDLSDGKRIGTGIYFLRTKGSEEPGYYYYDGEWKNDIPNGPGKTEEVITLKDDDGQKYINKTVTEGTYQNALEDGRMKKYFYIKGEETGRLVYTAQKGVPMPLAGDNGQPMPTPEAGHYIIGKLTLNGKPTGEYYSVMSQLLWGVSPFIKNK